VKPDNAILPCIPSDFSEAGLEDAIISLLGDPKIARDFDIRVSEHDLPKANSIVDEQERVMKAIGLLNPFHFKVILDPTYSAYEWSVTHNGNIYWSSGA